MAGFVDNGGLISYGPNRTACYRLAGDYAGKVAAQVAQIDIANLPILTPSSELVINLAAASAIGYSFPQQVINQATDVVLKPPPPPAPAVKGANTGDTKETPPE